MMTTTKAILLVNFGGPRNLDEVAPFLTALLTDPDVIRTKLPSLFQKWLFQRIAKKRAPKVQKDYLEIGGKSPIYFDTEQIASTLSQKLNLPVYTFHRYLTATHPLLKNIPSQDEITVLPLFPQFCYATTGSIARFFSRHLKGKLRWIKSYAAHPAFISAYSKRISDFLTQNNLVQEETILLFSAHGVPKQFILEGDIYESECNQSFSRIMKNFPQTLGKLSYQSKFGKGEWLRPYTDEICSQILEWNANRKNVVFVPISFTSDHIETLFEIEQLYLPLIQEKGLKAYRCPALNLEPYWIDALIEILQDTNLCNNQMLVRK